MKKIKKLFYGLKKNKIINFLNQIRIYLINRNSAIPTEELGVFNAIKDDLHVVFDVGAREDLSFYNLKNDCEYHLFEPNKKFVKSLKKQISLIKNHKIKINEFGLSDENRDKCVYYENSQSFIINPVLKVGFDFGRRCSLRKLDDYVKDNKIDGIDFLKIDAEGLDYRIILGGLDTIRNKVKYIQFEYWDGVHKFADILKDYFELYLMMEPGLLRIIKEKIYPIMMPEQRAIDYSKSIIKLDKRIMDLIDNKLVPMDFGGNILGIKKEDKNLNINKLIFDIL